MAIRAEEYVLKGNEFLDHVATQLNRPDDKDHASRVTLSVLHTLRDALTPYESLRLIAQLPLYIKATYVDGWKLLNNKPDSLDSFIQSLRFQDNGVAENDFTNDETTKNKIMAVINVLKKYTGKSEIDILLSKIPAELSHGI